MSKVYTGASMSLDGYIAGPAETGFEHLFKWYGNGDVVVPTTHPGMTLRMSAVSAEHFHNIVERTGALVVGRRLFDLTGAWGGNHPMGRPVVVVTHRVPDGWPREDAPFTFVTDGIQSAIHKAQALAGDKSGGGQRWHHRPGVPQRGPARRDLDRSRPRPARRWDPILRPAEGRSDRAAGTDLGRRGHQRHPPAVPRPLLTEPVRKPSGSCLTGHEELGHDSVGRGLVARRALWLRLTIWWQWPVASTQG